MALRRGTEARMHYRHQADKESKKRMKMPQEQQTEAGVAELDKFRSEMEEDKMAGKKSEVRRKKKRRT